MTYCVAWKSDEAVFFTSDSAVTTKGILDPLKKETSSLGELTITKQNVSIEEGINKIYRIENSLLLCFSGNVNLFFEVFNTLKKYYSIDNPLLSMQLAIGAIRTNLPLDLQLLFSFKTNEDLKLFSFNLSNDNKIKEHNKNELIHIGSLSKDSLGVAIHKQFTHGILNSKDSSFIKQIYLHFLLQSMSIYENTIPKGVGGLYNTAFITPTEINFLDDTSIILYEPKFDENTLIPVGICNYFNRMDAFIYNSTISNTKEIFISDKSNYIYNSIKAQNSIETYSLNYEPKIIVFYSTKTRLVSIFILQETSNYFILSFNEGKITLQVTQNCLNLLLQNNQSKQLMFNLLINV